MAMTDPISDMLTRIRNANAVRKESVVMPHSKFREAIARILTREGYVDSFDRVDDQFSSMVIKLKYNGTERAIEKIERVSTPGTRTYVNSDNIPHVLNGYGIAIISTSNGLMTDKEARKARIGGEIICNVQ